MTEPVVASTEPTVALVDEDGRVLQVIVADAEFAARVTAMRDDPETETPPEWARVARAVDVTGKSVTLGHVRAANGHWIDGRPFLRGPADLPEEATEATVTFVQKGPDAPGSVTFVVDGEPQPPVPLNASGEAQISVPIGAEVVEQATGQMVRPDRRPPTPTR